MEKLKAHNMPQQTNAVTVDGDVDGPELPQF